MLAAIPRTAHPATGIRAELAAALAAIVPPTYGVVGKPASNVSLPAFILSPGIPAVTPAMLAVPYTFDYRFVWWAVVGRLVVDPLDELEAMAAYVEESIRGIRGGSYDGIQVGIQVDQLAGVDCYTAQNDLHVKRSG